MYPLNLCEIMRDLVMPRWFSYVSYEPMRDYAGFGYALLLFRLCFDCLCCFGYVLIVGYVIELYEEYYIIWMILVMDWFGSINGHPLSPSTYVIYTKKIL